MALALSPFGHKIISNRTLFLAGCGILSSATSPFLARDIIVTCICYSALYAIARPSVCPSVTRVDQSKTVEVRITKPSSQSSPMTLVSWCLTSPWNSKGKTGSRGAEWHRGRKNTKFRQKVAVSQKKCKIGPKLLLMSNRNLHMRFRLVPKSSTLDDLELL